MYNNRDRIKKILAIKSITLQDFCKKIGLNSTTTIAKIISEDRKPSSKTIGRIMKAYPDINYDWLVTGEGSIKGESAEEPIHTELTETAMQIIAVLSENEKFRHEYENKVHKNILQKFTEMHEGMYNFAHTGTSKVVEKIDNAIKRNDAVLNIALQKIMKIEEDLETMKFATQAKHELAKIQKLKEKNGKK